MWYLSLLVFLVIGFRYELNLCNGCHVLHEKKNLRFTKFLKRTENINFSLFLVCFRFTELSYFLIFPSNENVRKQHLSTNAYSCVNMKFSYTIAVRKIAAWYCSKSKLLINFLLKIWICIFFLSYIFSLISCNLLFLLHGNKRLFIIINVLKICFQKSGYWI